MGMAGFYSAVIRILLFPAVLLGAAALPTHGQNDAAKPGSWSGILVTSACNADEAFAESPECFKNVPGAKVSLYDDTNRVMYEIEPQEKITGHLGDTVTVRGAIEDDVIRMATMGPMAIGLEVGQQAPAFSLRDQLGRVQTLDSLRGPKGTVLLFFRSADW